MKLAAAKIMQKLDSCAINDYGIPGVVLMENAGRGTVDAMLRHFKPLAGKVISIVVGPGNNGGDGLVIARHLHQIGLLPHVFLLVDPEKTTGDAAINWRIVERLPVKISLIKSEDDLMDASVVFKHSALLVDAIFGIGLKREVGGLFAEAVASMNQANRPVLAVDIPSGLNSDTGMPLGCSVEADLTVTYGLAKPGHVTYPGVQFTGELEVVDIGIPPEVIQNADIRTELLQKNDAAQFVPKRPAAGHKGSFGHLLVLAGSHGKTGAAILAAMGALRSGVGLVTLGVPQKLNHIFEARLIEAMTVPLASDYHLSLDDYPAIENALQRKTAVLTGPGLGLAEGTGELVRKLWTDVDLPMVADADALTILADGGLERGDGKAVRVITPHPGEMSRLTGLAVKEIQADRIKVASSYAVKNNITLVLKGAATVVAAADGRVAVNPTGNQGMAAGGMGDVLAGVIGSLLAQGLSGWEASCLGAYVHGLAADRIAAQNGIEVGFLASEVAGEMPLAFKGLKV